KNLEGYMYPSTYTFPRKTSPETVIKRMVDQFRTLWKPEWTSKAKQMNRTPHEIVTLASLIETESHVPAERPVVASVIYNRLAKSIPLSIDQTAVYVAKMQNLWVSEIMKREFTPDYTYKCHRSGGIQPGTLSSITESSITEAPETAQTDHIYSDLQVQTNDGANHCYSCTDVFERGK